MLHKTITLIGTCLLLLLAATACDSQPPSLAVGEVQAQIAAVDEMLAASTVMEGSPAAAASGAVLETGGGTMAEANATSSTDQESAANSAWASASELAGNSAGATEIALEGDAITVTGEGVTVDGRTATITAAGTYSLSGSLSEGQIVVDTEDEEPVQLILNGVDITNTSTAPLFVANAAETHLVLAENSTNSVADGATYVFEDAAEDEPNAAIFSKDDLLIYGEGALTVAASYNDGIASKDDLTIGGGSITVHAADDGLRGKQSLTVVGGTLFVTAQGDGLKADEDEDTSQGTIMIEGGDITVTSGGDAIEAETNVLITGGSFNLTSGGGSANAVYDDTSAKGIKAAVNVTINGGTFSINAADDAVHSNDTLVLNDGVLEIATGDDGFHADATAEFNGGTVNIIDSFEGIESAVITINDGYFTIAASDDGINVAGGNDGSGFGPGGGPGGGGRPRGGFDGGPGQDTFAEYAGDYYLTINGGTILIDAGGDGLDSNGAIEMTNGAVIIHGPTEQMNSALDYQGTFTISGGFMVAAGSAGMAQTADASSTQNALLMNLNGTLQGGTLIHIADSSGNNVLTFAPTKAYQSIAFSSPQLSTGETYTVYYGGSASGSAQYGLYVDGAYSDGAELGSFTIADTVTRLGNSGRP